MELVAGRQIGSSLRLVRELGRGGMGRVWVADHLALKTHVAVKFLAEWAAAAPDAIARFEGEATAAARIRSPHVVQVFDHGFVDEVPYMVMELLEGEDLSNRLAREGRMSTSDTVTIVSQVCKALGKAHGMGIIHRDVKPANIFLMSAVDEVFVKVLDFGLAKHVGGLLGGMTASHAVFGTPHYVSPEQAESAREVTPQSDLWSVAVVVYQCLTGKRPFEAESLMGLCIALHEVKYAPATSLRPELPKGIDAWFERAFQHEPEARFASANELATTLATALGEARAPAVSAPDFGAVAAAPKVTVALRPEAHAPAVVSSYEGDERPVPVDTRTTWGGGLIRTKSGRRTSPWVVAILGLTAVGVALALRIPRAGPSAEVPATITPPLPSHATAVDIAASALPAPQTTSVVASSAPPAPAPPTSAVSTVAHPPAQRVAPRPRPAAHPKAPAPTDDLFSDPKN